MSSKVSAFQSVLLAISLGVMGWVGHKAADNAEQLAGMRASMESVKEATTKAERSQGEALLRLERKIDEVVPRREFEAKLLLVEAEQRKADIRLREIDVEILKLKTFNH